MVPFLLSFLREAVRRGRSGVPPPLSRRHAAWPVEACSWQAESQDGCDDNLRRRYGPLNGTVVRMPLERGQKSVRNRFAAVTMDPDRLLSFDGHANEQLLHDGDVASLTPKAFAV